jgi:hypothetical protein
MDLSIIILSYNTKKLTLRTLETVFSSLQQAPFRYEVLVLDNASKDGSVAAIKEKFANKVQLIVSKENLGFSEGNNVLVRSARGKHLLFLNSDIEVLDNAIVKLYNYYQTAKVAFIGGKLFNIDKTPQASCGPFYSLPVAFAALFLRGDYWGLTRSSPNESRLVDWVSGACILTTKAIFQKLSGFDENIFMYMEEIDLLFRARKRGLRTAFFPDAKFIHWGSASANGRSEPIINVFKGFLYFYKKHHSRWQLFILRCVLQSKAAVGYTLGVVFNNKYLIKTYERAFKVVYEA